MKVDSDSLWVYVAGPYTNPDPIIGTRNAVLAAEDVRSWGAVPIIPHLSMLWHLISPHEDINFWYEYDLKLLEKCDALLRLPGASSGADAEVRAADYWDIPVFIDRVDLFNWMHS